MTDWPSVDGDRHPIWLRRFLDQGTTWQKLLLAFGAIAGALLAIGALAAALNRLVDGDDGPTRSEPATTSSSDGASTFRRADPLKSETADVDELVALLTLAADAYAAEPNSPDSRVVLDFHVDAEPQDSGRIKLNYGCPNDPPCEAASAGVGTHDVRRQSGCDPVRGGLHGAGSAGSAGPKHRVRSS